MATALSNFAAQLDMSMSVENKESWMGATAKETLRVLLME